MEVMQAVKGRRSVRAYRPDPVSEEDLTKVMEAARWAPSWGNTQTRRIVVVRNAGVKAQIADSIYSSVPGTSNRAAQGFRNANVALVVCAQEGLSGFYRTGPKKGTPSTELGERWYMFDAGMAMQNLTLAAHEIGLGTVHIGVFERDKVRKIINAPPDVAIIELMALGWPADSPAPTPRREVSEFVFRDGFPQK